MRSLKCTTAFLNTGNRILALAEATDGQLASLAARGVMLATMPVTVTLELRLKPKSVAAARDVMGRALQDTRSFDGNLRTDVFVDEDDEAHWLIYELWATVENDEAYRRFRAGEGRLTQLPPLLAAPPIKTRYVSSDI
jgi:quinol monooxygenase YgiN